MRTILRCVPIIFAAAAVDAQQTAAPRLTAVQELRIDGASEDLSGLASVIIGPRGSMIFVEPQDFRLRFYNVAGKEIARFGRRGQGPGEFDLGGQTRPVAAIGVSLGTMGDTIWAWDRGTQRFTLITSDGKLIKSIGLPAKLPNPESASAPQVGTERRLLSFAARAIFADGSRLGRATWGRIEIVTRDGRDVPMQRSDGPAEYAIANADGDITRIVGRIPTTESSVSVVRDGGLRQSSSAVPFIEPTYESVAQDASRIAFGITTVAEQSGVLKIVVVSMRGDTTLKRDVSFAPIAIAKSSLDSAMADRMRAYRPSPDGKAPTGSPDMADEMESKLRAAMPSAMSPYRGMTLGLDNSIWLLMRTPPGSTRDYFVLNAQGNPHGIVSLPKETATLARASLTNVWAIAYDADALPSLVRYHITR
ncbi:MAG TPA: hypothetical protein VJR92_11050 [Gemmatimonadaceae bacterium]|nr:hypothetical protein [Gemmatimonadaceae bacterium]